MELNSYVQAGTSRMNQKVALIGRPKGKTVRYTWSVAGRTVANEETAETTFLQEGQFEIRFRVEDQAGLSDEKTRTVSVTEQPLIVRFSADAGAQSGQRVWFANETSGGITAHYEWDFGDGVKSEETNATHVFSVVGAKAVVGLVRL